jgi:hypothetical protein
LLPTAQPPSPVPTPQRGDAILGRSPTMQNDTVKVSMTARSADISADFC